MQHTTLKTLALAVASALSLSAYADDTMETVVVTASRNEMPLERVGSSITVITQEEIQQKGYTNLADLLRTTPGIAVSNAGGAGGTTAIRIRGEEGFRTKVLVDGVDLNDPTSTQIQPEIEHISLAEVERIEVLRGPQGMMYGADAGGVINIITKRAQKDFSANFSTEYGRYNTSNTSGNLNGKNDVFDYSLSASTQATDGFNAQTEDVSLRDRDGYNNNTLGARIGANITDKLRTQLTLRDVNADNQYDDCFGTDDCLVGFHQTSQKADLIYSGTVFSHQFSLSNSDIARDFRSNGSSSYAPEGNIQQAQYIGTARINKRDTLLYGVDQSQDAITDDGSGAEFERDQRGVYAEWQSSIGQQFFYTAGVRNDDNDDFGSHTTYRTTAAWLQPIADDELKYKASYGTGFRAPSLYEFSYNHGPWASPPATLHELTPETSSGYDAGVELHLSGGASFEAVYFNQTIEDAIDWDSSGWTGYLQESGTSKSEGIELSADLPINTLVVLYGNYTYNDTTDSNGDQRLRRPRHYGNIGTRIKLDDKVTLLAAMRFANGAEDIKSGSRVDLDDYQVFDLTASYQLTPAFELYARGQNVFGQKYEEVTGFNTAREAFYAGLRYKY